MIMIFYLLPGITLGGFFWGEEMMDLMCSECVIKTTLFLRKMILWVLFFLKTGLPQTWWHIIHYIIIGFIQTIPEQNPYPSS